MELIDKVAIKLQDAFLRKGYDIDSAECYEVARYNIEESYDFNVDDYVNETIERWPDSIEQFKIKPIKVFMEFCPSPTIFIDSFPVYSTIEAMDYLRKIANTEHIFINKSAYTLAQTLGEEYFIEWNNDRDLDYANLSDIWHKCNRNIKKYEEELYANYNKESEEIRAFERHIGSL